MTEAWRVSVETGSAIGAVLSVQKACSGVGHEVRLTVCDRGPAGLGERSAAAGLGPDLEQLAGGAPGGGAGAGDAYATADAYVRVLDRRAAQEDRRTAGQRLFQNLIRDGVAELWADLDARAAGQELRVRLDVASPLLRGLPWELLRDGHQWLWLRPHTSWWRGATPQPAAGPADDPGPLRVLLVVCNPLDQRLLGDDELARVGGALAGQLGRIHVEVLDGPSRDRLSEEIDRLHPHVLHFIGHGMPRVAAQTAALAFNWVPPDRTGLGGALPTPWELGSDEVNHLATWTPRLVVVNACRTAEEPMDQVGGFTAAFLAAGARAVVSMQADVESPAAVQFSSAFYDGLADMAPLDRIVADARRRVAVSLGDHGEWALPVLATRTDPADVLRITFPVPRSSISILCGRQEYRRLHHFLDRSAERRRAWWALDPPDHAEARSLLVISGRSASGPGPTGKTWLTLWCLFTYFLRGHRVTYVDLAEPLRHPRPGMAGERGVTSKNWLDVIRVIREATMHPRQPDPLPDGTFSDFNAALNVLLSGPARTADEPGGGSVDYAGSGGDEWRSLDDERRHAEHRTDQIISEFLMALQSSAGDRPHVIALDHADRILPEDFDWHVYPKLIRPVAEGRHQPVRLVLVAPEDWVAGRLPAADDPLWAALNLGDFEPTLFMRLARDYCHRRGIDFDALSKVFAALQPLHAASVRVTLFDDVLKAVPADMQGGR